MATRGRVVEFVDLSLLFKQDGPDRYSIFSSTAGGEASGEFRLPFSRTELESLILRLGLPSVSRRGPSPRAELVPRVAQQLFDAVFTGPLLDQLRLAEGAAASEDRGLRLLLVFRDAPEFERVPWELIAESEGFSTPPDARVVVRAVPARVRPPFKTNLPLRVLAVLSAPSGVEPVDPTTRGVLERGLEQLVSSGALQMDWLENPSRSALNDALRRSDHEILHFIGHLGSTPDEAAFVLSSPDGAPEIVETRRLTTVIGSADALRLVVLHRLAEARSTVEDPFASLAVQLVAQGVPAVVGTQFELTDAAAVTFYSALYGEVTNGASIHAAVTASRAALATDADPAESAAPVLTMQPGDGRLFDFSGRRRRREAVEPESSAAPPPVDDTLSSASQSGVSSAGADEVTSAPGDTAATATTPPEDGPLPSAFQRSGYSSDMVPATGPISDHLQMQAEVEALAWVVAARDASPPLSIGLFGAWGTGKSTFMGLMQARINEIACDAHEARERLEDHPACEYIRQVTFNAWHYADANLWASLVTHLFEQLAKPADDAPSTEYRNLVERLETTQSLRHEAETRRNLVADERKRRLGQLDRVKRHRTDVTQDLKHGLVDPSLVIVDPSLLARAKQVEATVREQLPVFADAVESWLTSILSEPALLRRAVEVIPDPTARQQLLEILDRPDVQAALEKISKSPSAITELARFLATAGESGTLEPLIGADVTEVLAQFGGGLRDAYADAVAVRETARTLTATAGRARYLLSLIAESARGRGRWVLGGLVALVLAVVGVYSFVAANRPSLEAWAATVTGIIGAAGVAVRIVREPVRSLGAAVDVAVDLVQTRARHQIDELAVQEQALEREIEDLTHAQHAAEREIADIRLGNRLYRYLEERATSADYRPYLGIIARIRKDFDTMTRLMDEGREARDVAFEARRNPKFGDPQPDEAAAEANVATSPTPDDLPAIDRVILYVDDLDRCPANRVVEVLEAVHLLLALKLFVVVVGVDPRWLMRSLRNHYTAQLAPTGAALSSWEGDAAYWESTPENYLEKIFQVPFALRPMTPDGYQALISDVLRPPSDDEETPGTEQPSGRQPPPTSIASTLPPADTLPPAGGPGAQGAGPALPDGSAEGAEATDGSSPSGEPPMTVGDTAAPAEGVIAPPEGAESASTSTPIATPAPDADPAPVTPPRRVLPPPRLAITDDELAFIKALGAFVPTPRSAKRFANTYRLIRVMPKPPKVDPDPVPHRIPLTLLAIVIGYPAIAGELFEELFESSDPTWTAFVTRAIAGRQPAPVDPVATQDADQEAAARATAREWARLARDLGTIPVQPTARDDLEAYQAWGQLVGRFSFESGRVTAMAAEREAP